MHSTKPQGSKRSWLFLAIINLLLLPRLLWADSAPSTPAVTSIILPQAYRVLCDTDPALRPSVLQSYANQLSHAGISTYQPFFQSYGAALQKLAGDATESLRRTEPKYPVVLRWINPATQQSFYLEAYSTNEVYSAVFPMPRERHWELIDLHNPMLQAHSHVYKERGMTKEQDLKQNAPKEQDLKGALNDFLRNNPYPNGNWDVHISVPGEYETKGVFSSGNSSGVPKGFITPPVPVLRFQGPSGNVTDCAQQKLTGRPYPITNLGDPKTKALLEHSLRVAALRAQPLQQGALLTHLEPSKGNKLTKARIFWSPKNSTGFLVDPNLVSSLQLALADTDPKRSIDALYALTADPSRILSFASYENLSERFFYREVFSKEAVLDPKETLDLREQKGWEQWKKDAARELRDIKDLVVQPDGCIKGKRGNDETFEVCGTTVKKSQIVTFYQKTKKGRKVIGHAHVGERLHTHRGLLLDANGHTVAYLPLESTWMHKKLPKAIKLVLYGLPRDAFQVVADLFTFQGVWDLGMSAVKGVIRTAILDFFGPGWVREVYEAVQTIGKIRAGYQMYEVLSRFWGRLNEAKEEHQLYYAADEVRPMFLALLKQMIQQKLVEKAKEAYRNQTASTPKPPQEQLLLPGRKEPYGLLTTSQADVDSLIMESHEVAPFTEVNARLLLTGPASAQTYELEIPQEEHGLALTFFDKENEALLTKEAKSVKEVGKDFAKPFEMRLLEGAREEGEEGARQLFIQAPAGQDVIGALDVFQEDHEGKQWLEKYKGVELVVVGPSDIVLYRGPVFEAVFSISAELHGQLNLTLRNLQGVSKAYKALLMEDFEGLLQKEWKRVKIVKVGDKTLRAYTGANNTEEYALFVQKGLEEVARLRKISNEINEDTSIIPKIAPRENVSFAEFESNGQKRSLMAVSSRDVQIAKNIGGREVIDPKSLTQKILQPSVVGRNSTARDTDGEYRILEFIAQQLGGKRGEVFDKVTGTVILFSERAACKSCRDVLGQFQKMFPNVRVQLNAGPSTKDEDE